MTIELWALFGCAVVLFLSITLQAAYLDLSAGVGYSLSNRDQPPADQTILHGRFERLVRNQVEGLALFLPIVLIAAIAGVSNAWTQYGALAYVASRALFVPAFLFGWVPWRSVIWVIGFFCALPAFAWGLLGSG